MSLTSIVLGFVATVAARRPDPKDAEIARLKEETKLFREILARERDQRIAHLTQLAHLQMECDRLRAFYGYQQQAAPLPYQAPAETQQRLLRQMNQMAFCTCVPPGRASMFRRPQGGYVVGADDAPTFMGLGSPGPLSYMGGDW